MIDYNKKFIKIHHTYSFQELDVFYLMEINAGISYKNIFALIPKINQVQWIATTMVHAEWELIIDSGFRTTAEKLATKYVDPKISIVDRQTAVNIFPGIKDTVIRYGMEDNFNGKIFQILD